MTVTVENKKISTWKDFADLVESYAGKQWIFRGVRRRPPKEMKLKGGKLHPVPNEIYDLLPGIGRPLRNVANISEPSAHSLRREKALLQLFMSEARCRFEYTPASDALLEWMVMGQHHRLLTRLLDWSESLLVAAFFAVEDPLLPGAIYGVKTPAEVSLDADPFTNLGSVPLLVRPPHINPRITAQKAVLTLHPQPKEPWDSDTIHCWEIDTAPGKALKLKKLLAFAGIHEGSLFPDSADHHLAYLSWRYKWDDLPSIPRKRKRKKSLRS